MDIVKTLIVKTQKNKYAFDLTKNTYSFCYESAHAETEGRFRVYENNEEIPIIRENTNYVNFYINSTKAFSFAKNTYHDFELLESGYRNVAVICEPRYMRKNYMSDTFTIFKADEFSIKLSDELTFVKTNDVYTSSVIRTNNSTTFAFICLRACDFGVQDKQYFGLHNIVEVAKLITEGTKIVYSNKREGNWLLTLSDKGKGLISKYNFVNS